MTTQKDWSIIIKKAENGYITQYLEEVGERDGEPIYNKERFVFERKDTVTFDEDRKSELEAMKELLWFISSYFGVYHNKHSKYNLSIKIEKNGEDEE